MVRDGGVMLPKLSRGQPEVTSSLAGYAVAEFGEDFGEVLA